MRAIHYSSSKLEADRISFVWNCGGMLSTKYQSTLGSDAHRYKYKRWKREESQMPEETIRGRYVFLDGIRGVAAIAVMVFHYTNHQTTSFFRNAPVAVDLFFILSGFVLCFSYRKRVESGALSFKKFMIKRIIRLYPMFFLGALIGSGTLFLMVQYRNATYSHHEIIAAFMYNALFVPYFNNGGIYNFARDVESVGGIFPVNPPAWSLFAEMFANLFFIKLISLNSGSLRTILGTAICAMIVMAVLQSFAGYSSEINVDMGWGTINFFGAFPRVFWGFTLGILIERTVSASSTSRGLTKLLIDKSSALRRHPLLLYAIVLGMFSIPFELKGITTLVCIAVICPIIVVIGASVKIQSRIGEKVSEFLGWISYPMYCLHMPIGNLIAIVNREGSSMHALSIPFVPLAGVASLAFCVIAEKFYEEPVRSLLSRKVQALWGSI